MVPLHCWPALYLAFKSGMPWPFMLTRLGTFWCNRPVYLFTWYLPFSHTYPLKIIHILCIVQSFHPYIHWKLYLFLQGHKPLPSAWRVFCSHAWTGCEPWNKGMPCYRWGREVGEYPSLLYSPVLLCITTSRADLPLFCLVWPLDLDE